MFNLEIQNKSLTIEQIKSRVDSLITDWQKQIPEVSIVLGGSLVSDLFVLDDKTKVIDVDIRFLTDEEPTEALREKIEKVTGLKYRKTITVADWPSGESQGQMIEGQIKLPDFELPLDVEGCLRNTHYVGWARFYNKVLTSEELTSFLEKKKQLRQDKTAYKDLKKHMLQIVMGRCIERGLVSLPMQE